MIFVDTNVLIDILGAQSEWRPWSEQQLEEHASAGEPRINIIVLAELSPGYPSLDALLELLANSSIQVVPIEEEAAFLAGNIFAQYRRERSRDMSLRVLPDFMIGAHATVLALPLLTRHPALYRRYFPELTLITPENHP